PVPPRSTLLPYTTLFRSEPKSGRVHVDRPVLEESETIPLRDPIGDGRTMDAHGTGRRLEAHPITPKVWSAPDHYFPQNVEVEFVESIHETVRGLDGFGLDGSSRDSAAERDAKAGTGSRSAGLRRQTYKGRGAPSPSDGLGGSNGCRNAGCARAYASSFRRGRGPSRQIAQPRFGVRHPPTATVSPRVVDRFARRVRRERSARPAPAEQVAR